jgi:hypothetical protein
MRSNLTISFLVTCLFLLSNKIIAQDDLSISVFYKYDYKFQIEKQNYPLGFGSSISKNISKKFILSAGFEYSHYSHEYQNKITPTTYRTKEVFKDSFYSINIGLSYPILDNKFAIKIGSCLLPSYFNSKWDFYRYLVSNDLLDLHIKDYHDYFALGIKAKIDFVYSLNQDICFFIQPGYTYYLTSDTNSKFFNGSAGVIFIL